MRKTAIFAAVLALASCGTDVSMTKEEIELINGSPDVMRILSVDNEADRAVLRSSSTNLNAADLNTAEYAALARKLVCTLESTDGGVGLAAPQVGINRRVVAVQRMDKEGEPIEVYPNIRIEEFRGGMEEGPEGCLSVPDQRGNVLRYRDITVVYTSIGGTDQPREVREDISGFTAVIFQHEVDHLDGIVFTDKSLPLTGDGQ